MTLRPILYACWSVCVCVFAHVRFCSSDYYTESTARLDARAGEDPALRASVARVYVPRTQRSAYRLPRHRLPPGYSELAGRRRYGGLPARHTRVAVLVHRSELTRSCVFKSARWRDDNATPRRTATWRDDKAAPRTAARSGPRGLTSNYAVACGPLPCVCMTSLLLRSVHRRVGLFTGGWVRPAAPGGSKTMLWEERHMGEAATGSRRCGGQSLCEFTLVRLELISRPR